MNDKAQGIKGVPIVIGVAGHRHADFQGLRDAGINLDYLVKSYLSEFIRRYPGSDIVLLSGMADGADQYVVDLVNRDEYLSRNINVIALLPMPVKKYCRTLQNYNTEEKLVNYLAQTADYYFVIPAYRQVRKACKKKADDELYYRALAEYIAKYSHFVMVFWDGKPAAGKGGTGEVVSLIKNGTHDLSGVRGTIHEPASAGPVHWITTPRRGVEYDDMKPGQVTDLYPDQDCIDCGESVNYWEILAQINDYNRIRLDPNQRMRKQQQSSGESLKAPEPAAISALMKRCRSMYAAADVLAVNYKARHHRMLYWLFGLPVLGYVCLETFDERTAGKDWLGWIIFGFPLLIIVASVILRFCQKLYNRHLECRGLAEGLRVQFFWDIAGVSADVHDHYINKHQKEIRWIRWVLKALRIPLIQQTTATKAGRDRNTDQNIRFVKEHWIDQQKRFYAEQINQLRSREAGFQLLGKALIYLVSTLAIILVGLHVALYQGLSETAYATGKTWLIYFIAISFVGCGAVIHYIEKSAFSSIQHQYLQVYGLFQEASRQLQLLLDKGELKQARKLLVEVGIEALQEHGDWIRLRRLNPPEIQIG